MEGVPALEGRGEYAGIKNMEVMVYLWLVLLFGHILGEEFFCFDFGLGV